MSQRRPIRRWVVPAAVFLLLGAVVNVAVAWTVRFHDTDGYVRTELDSTYVERNWSRHAPEQWPSYSLEGIRTTYFGNEREELYFWSIKNRNQAFFLVTVYRSGWPARGLEGVGIETGHSVDAPPRQRNESSRLQGLFVLWNERVPFHPVWPGFAINTVFYAVMLWLFCSAPFVLRRKRRVRKGLCTKCAYPIGKSVTCTECGHVVH